ncbi:hypothetical protein LCGC14_2058250 [marine sediment metagenome]|uniref:FlgD Ig-like domain-containing protein n=1 Tax=marine sediment metagenome TaxID=412755 RepID=A0A0F9ELU7_9ZZZZ
MDAGVPFNVYITNAMDMFSNPVDATINVNWLDSDDSIAASPDGTTPTPTPLIINVVNGVGSAQLTLFRRDTNVRLRATTVPVTVTVDSTFINVNPDAQVLFKIMDSTSIDAWTPTPLGDQKINSNISVLIYAFDQFDNIADFNGTATIDDLTNTVYEVPDPDEDDKTLAFVSGQYAGNLKIIVPYKNDIINITDGTAFGASNTFKVVGNNIEVSLYTDSGAAEAPGIAISGERIAMFDFEILNRDPANTVNISNIHIFVESRKTEGSVKARPASLISSMEIYDISSSSEVLVGENVSPNNTLDAVDVDVSTDINLLSMFTEVPGGTLGVDLIRLRVYVTIKDDISKAEIPNIQLRIGDIKGVFTLPGTVVRPTNKFGNPIKDPAYYIRSDLTNLKSGAAEAAFNYPNPFNPRKQSTTIVFFNSGSKATVKIYSITGGLVRNLSKQTPQKSDSVEVEWDGKNGRGRIVKNGVYVAVIKANGKRIMVKIAVVK